MPLAASAVVVGLLLQGLQATAALSGEPGVVLTSAPSGVDSQPPASSDDREPRQAPQDQPGKEKPPTPVHTGIHALFDGYLQDLAHLPSLPNAYLTMVGGAAALSLHPQDTSFNVHLRSHYDLVNHIYAPAKYFGDTPEQVGLSVATYALGRLFDNSKMSHLGMDLLRAQLLTETLVEPLKFATHRERPDGSNHQSFPSGHAAITFAAATVIERHLGWKRSALAYLVAAYVATSRLHDNRHYLSDVLFGSAVGAIAGRTVTEHGATYWSAVPVSIPGGVEVLAVRVNRP